MEGTKIKIPKRKQARIEIIPLIDVIFFLLATFVLFTLSLNKSNGVPGINQPASDTGEPRNPELNRWAAEALAAPILEFYDQSEMSVNFANHHGLSHPVKVGSVGQPSPGFACAILDDELEVTVRQRPHRLDRVAKVRHAVADAQDDRNERGHQYTSPVPRRRRS